MYLNPTGSYKLCSALRFTSLLPLSNKLIKFVSDRFCYIKIQSSSSDSENITDNNSGEKLTVEIVVKLIKLNKDPNNI